MSYSLPKITFFLFIFFGGSLYAQQLLTVEDAVEIALENNYGIN